MSRRLLVAAGDQEKIDQIQVVFFQPFPSLKFLPLSGNLCVTGGLSAGLSEEAVELLQVALTLSQDVEPCLPQVGKGNVGRCIDALSARPVSWDS